MRPYIIFPKNISIFLLINLFADEFLKNILFL
jgi:hypothetical protein